MKRAAWNWNWNWYRYRKQEGNSSREQLKPGLANLWLLLIPFSHAIWPPIKCGHFAFSSLSFSLSLYVCVFLCHFPRDASLMPPAASSCPALPELNWAEVSICHCSCRARFVAQLNRFAVRQAAPTWWNSQREPHCTPYIYHLRIAQLLCSIKLAKISIVPDERLERISKYFWERNFKRIWILWA